MPGNRKGSSSCAKTTSPGGLYQRPTYLTGADGERASKKRPRSFAMLRMTGGRRAKPLAEHVGEVEGFPSGELRDLLAAGEAVGNDERVCVRAADGRQKSALSDLDGDV